MNARLEANLLRGLIERCPRAVKHPARTITAPEPKLPRAYTDEAVRQAQFDQSRRTTGGVVAPFLHLFR